MNLLSSVVLQKLNLFSVGPTRGADHIYNLTTVFNVFYLVLFLFLFFWGGEGRFNRDCINSNLEREEMRRSRVTSKPFCYCAEHLIIYQKCYTTFHRLLESSPYFFDGARGVQNTTTSLADRLGFIAKKTTMKVTKNIRKYEYVECGDGALARWGHHSYWLLGWKNEPGDARGFRKFITSIQT